MSQQESDPANESATDPKAVTRAGKLEPEGGNLPAKTGAKSEGIEESDDQGLKPEPGEAATGPAVGRWIGIVSTVASAGAAVLALYGGEPVLAGIWGVGILIGILLLAIVNAAVREITVGQGQFWQWFMRALSVCLVLYLLWIGIALLPTIIDAAKLKISPPGPGAGRDEKTKLAERKIEVALHDRDSVNVDLVKWLEMKPDDSDFKSTGESLLRRFEQKYDTVSFYNDINAFSVAGKYRYVMAKLLLAVDIVTTIQPLLENLPAAPEAKGWVLKADHYIEQTLNGPRNLVQQAIDVKLEIEKNKSSTEEYIKAYEDYFSPAFEDLPAISAAIAWLEAKMCCLRALLSKKADDISVADDKVRGLSIYHLTDANDPLNDPQMKSFGH